MRIGIHFSDFHVGTGGGHTYVADVFDGFLEMAGNSEHYFVIFCIPSAADAIRLKVKDPNVKVVPVALRSRLTHWLVGLKYISPVFRWLWRRRGPIERAARRYNVQLLWFVGVGVYECPDIPYVATMLDLQHRVQPFFPEVSSRGEWDAREHLYGYFLRRATYCVTGTETGKQQTQYLYQLAESRVRVLALPTPKFALDAGPSAIDVRSHFGLDMHYVFYPAQFWSHKNHANLILAVKWLKEQGNLDVTLALTGSDKGNLAFVKRFAEQQGMARQVRFLGFVTEEELVALYRQALALTYVTYFGPDNIPPLEAFALGCPVIASAVEGASEQYGDAVLQVDPSNPQHIGAAILQLHSDEKFRATLVEAGLKRASTWTSKDYIRGMFGLFNEFSAIRRNWP